MSWLSLTPYPAPDSAASGAAPDLFERFRRNGPRRPVLEFIEPCLSELAVLILNVIGAVAQVGRTCPMLRRSGARFEVAGRIVGVAACDWQAREATRARHFSPFVPHAEPRTRPPRVKSDAGVRASRNTRPIPSSATAPSTVRRSCATPHAHVNPDRTTSTAPRTPSELSLSAACAVTAEGASLPRERVSLLTEGEGDR